MPERARVPKGSGEVDKTEPDQRNAVGMAKKESLHQQTPERHGPSMLGSRRDQVRLTEPNLTSGTQWVWQNRTVCNLFKLDWSIKWRISEE